VLRQEFGPKWDEVTREWSRLHIDNLHDLYSSPDISGMIKSRILRCAVHVARFGVNKRCYRVW
jgi:hypothetical protein